MDKECKFDCDKQRMKVWQCGKINESLRVMNKNCKFESDEQRMKFWKRWTNNASLTVMEKECKFNSDKQRMQLWWVTKRQVLQWWTKNWSLKGMNI